MGRSNGKCRLNPRLMEIGRSAYEKSFNIRFVEEGAVGDFPGHDFRTRVIPHALPLGFPAQLAGKSVAVVGNGHIIGQGGAIDSHDAVIRISTMRNWQKSAEEDGLRTTLWAGQLAFVFGPNGVNPDFAQLVDRDVPLWALSPFHVTCDAYEWLRRRPSPAMVTVLPPPAVLFDVFHDYMSAVDMELLFSMPPARRQLTGLSRYECLLTGTRLVLALEACDVAAISLYGFDLFTRSEEPVWFGHDLDVDRQVLQSVQQRFAMRGRGFRWPDA